MHDVTAFYAVQALESVTAHGATVLAQPLDGGDIRGFSVVVTGFGLTVAEISTELPSLLAYACDRWLKAYEARVQELAA